MSHWAATYIGQPWVAGANDCWSFARRVWRERFGIVVPAVDVDANNRLLCARAFADHGHEERQNWRQVDVPQDGDAVLMAAGRRPSHVGVWVNGGILHCIMGAGVIWSSLSALANIGMKTTGYYRHA